MQNTLVYDYSFCHFFAFTMKMSMDRDINLPMIVKVNWFIIPCMILPTKSMKVTNFHNSKDKGPLLDYIINIFVTAVFNWEKYETTDEEHLLRQQ